MDDDKAVPQVVGKAETADGEDKDVVVAILYIPDPTERRGWRDMWIYKDKPNKERKAGFRR